jgi:hypothetical protein
MEQTTPKLEALLADPELFKTLPQGDQDSVYAGIAGLEAFMRAHLLVSRLSSREVAPPEPDRAVPLVEAARMLCMSKDFLYRNWHSLHGYRDKDRHIKFRLHFINHYLRQKELGRR